MHKKRVLLWVVLALALAGFGYLFFARQGYDPARVEPRLRALQTPYRSVTTGYYMDGGSIGIEITDHNGKSEQFAIPSHMGDPSADRGTRLYVGALYDTKPGAVEIKNPEHTRRMLVRILSEMPQRDLYDDICRVKLGRRPADFVALLIRRFITEGAPIPGARRSPAPAPFHSPSPPVAGP